MARTSKKLEDLFDMGPASEYLVASEEAKKEIEEIREQITTIDKIDAALPMIKSLEVHASEMDDLAERATKSFEDLSNMAMNQEPKFGARMFEVAGQMLGHAITAKTAKADKKLKAIELQLKKLKLDNDKGVADNAIDSTGIVMDRNDMIKMFLDQKE